MRTPNWWYDRESPPTVLPECRALLNAVGIDIDRALVREIVVGLDEIEVTSIETPPKVVDGEVVTRTRTYPIRTY